jgi:hypothetical protein
MVGQTGHTGEGVERRVVDRQPPMTTGVRTWMR